MNREYGPMGLRKSFGYDEVLRAIAQQPLDLPVPKRGGLKTNENIFFSNLINEQSSYVGGDVKKAGFLTNSHMNHHRDPKFTSMHGQMEIASPRSPPTGQIVEEEEEEVEEVVAGLLLLLATWEFFRAFMAVEEATCQFNQDIMQHRSVRIQF